MAQLVARLVRNEKVRGSNPLRSTNENGPFGAVFVCVVGIRFRILGPQRLRSESFALGIRSTNDNGPLRAVFVCEPVS